MTWININDALPEHKQTVHIYTYKNVQAILIFLDNTKVAEFLEANGIPREAMPNPTGYYFASQEVNGNVLHGVTHWKPIAEPPQ